jgi:anti-sigma factor RsiW
MLPEREVAGLRCGDVLKRLGDYLDGDLDPTEAEQVRAHLRGCEVCERFGGAMAAVVGELRRQLGEAGPLADDVAARLRERLDREGR